MNIVIANAPGILDNGQEVILFPSRWDSGIPKGGKKPFAFYPYQLAYLSALLKRESAEGNMPAAKVTMLDGNIEGWDGDTYIQRIADLQPDVLICELSALTYPTMTRVMQTVDPDNAILCGPMAHDKARANADGWPDCIEGEYELKVLERLGGTIPPGAKTHAGLINLDWLPWPEDGDISRDRYREINHYIDYKSDAAIIQVYPTRGCPLSCTFCVVPTYYGGHGKTSRSHRTRSVADVCDEIEYLAELYPNFAGCYFNEEAHSADPQWLADFCRELIRRGLNQYQYDGMCGMWSFSPELVQLCAEAGYKQIRFGVESTSESVGKAIKKTIHKAKTEEFLGWLKGAGIGAYITLQVGAMGSTEASDLATIADAKEWIRKGMVQKWQLSTSTPQPGTPFYDLCKKNGWLVTEDISQYDGMRAVVSYPEYSAERIQAVRDGAGL